MAADVIGFPAVLDILATTLHTLMFSPAVTVRFSALIRLFVPRPLVIVVSQKINAESHAVRDVVQGTRRAGRVQLLGEDGGQGLPYDRGGEKRHAPHLPRGLHPHRRLHQTPGMTTQ